MSRVAGRISTPLVLASSSAMIAIGIVAWAMARTPQTLREERAQRIQVAALTIDDRSPEAAAETFLDAWRRRAWDEAERVSTGRARERVRAKRAADARVHPEDREMSLEAWRLLASAPLDVGFDRSRDLGGGAIELHGIAGYDLVGQPYRREVEWIVVREADRWRVESMTLGRVITAVPRILEGVE